MTGLMSLPVLGQPHMVADTGCEVGEGPLWHPAEACLYRVELPGVFGMNRNWPFVFASRSSASARPRRRSCSWDRPDHG